MITTKRVIVTIVTIAVLTVAYWLISPLFYSVEVNEEAPKAVTESTTTVPSGVSDLTPQERQKMNEQMADMNATSSDKTMNEPMPSDSAAENQYPVQGTQGHPAEGLVRIIETSDGPVIRYENFDSINGPKLHLYLAKSLEAEEFVDLGPVKGTKGNINYRVSDGINLDEYRYVMYWCKPFSVLFNYAEINPPKIQ